MLKFIFWSLLALNALLFAYSRGLLGNYNGNEHEPARLKEQMGTDKLRLVPAPTVSPIPVAEAPAAAIAACIETGSFSVAEARRFEARLAPLQLGERQSRLNVAATDPTSHIVFIPPQGSKEAAERKAGELKSRGVTDYFIVSDNSALRWGISLGVFKTEAAAQTLLAALGKQGVHSARMAARGIHPSKLAFRFSAVDAATRAKIDTLTGPFAGVETRNCD
ncbi:MAG: hypothetical protein JWR40_41 [Massilia sp.]|nr:hypothetical protein [Massilia sp.]